MKELHPDTLSYLLRHGFRNPERVKWRETGEPRFLSKQLAPAKEGMMGLAHCTCRNVRFRDEVVLYFRRVPNGSEYSPLWIGQCSRCGTILWWKSPKKKVKLFLLPKTEG
jgi:hypothetical protein